MRLFRGFDMEQTEDRTSEDLEGLIDMEKERAIKANEVYRKVCEERGIKVSSWQDFSAWKEYVNGEIGETQFTEKVKTELEDFAKSFGKYMVVEKKDTTADKEEEDKKDRAKRANAIYKKVCEEAGLSLCFFNNFSTWSDYVKGQIDDSDFAQKAQQEVLKMEAEAKNN